MIITLLAAATAGLDALLVLIVAALMIPSVRSWLLPLARQWALVLTILLGWGAIGMSLFLEYAMHLQPCVLCWWQRIFMYPVALIALIAFIKNEGYPRIVRYVLPLSILGFIAALYQHLLQVLPSGALIPCDPTNDCAVRSVFEFGFVTLPWMAVTLCAWFIFLAWIARKAE